MHAPPGATLLRRAPPGADDGQVHASADPDDSPDSEDPDNRYGGVLLRARDDRHDFGAQTATMRPNGSAGSDSISTPWR